MFLCLIRLYCGVCFSLGSLDFALVLLLFYCFGLFSCLRVYSFGFGLCVCVIPHNIRVCVCNYITFVRSICGVASELMGFRVCLFLLRCLT